MAKYSQPDPLETNGDKKQKKKKSEAEMWG